jgi:polysaccharide biosynthesis protein PslF
MRILVISPSYPPAATGEAEHCRQIAARLAAAGHEVQVLTNVHAQAATPQGFSLQAVARGWRWRDVPGLQRLIRRSQPDAVLIIYTAWLYDDHPMATFAATWLRRWRPGLRVLALVELPFPAPPGSLPVRLGRKLAAWWAGSQGADFGFGSLLRDSTAVAVLGPSILADLQQRCPGLGERALVIPPPPLVRLPVDRSPAAREAARLRLGAAPGTLLLAYFGFVYPGKGVETLLAALRHLHQTGREVRLLMAGGGRGLPGRDPAQQAFEVRMQALASELGVADRVSWLPGEAGDSEAMGRDLLAADLAVLPFDDGAELRRSSIAVVTSLGLPLVTTQPLDDEPAFVHGVNVQMCARGDAPALAAAVALVADDPRRRQELAAGAAALAREWFSWSTATAQMLAALGDNRAPEILKRLN